jgi:hypothetical protein
MTTPTVYADRVEAMPDRQAPMITGTKGARFDPMHIAYAYTSPSQLLEDFFADVQEVIGREQEHR